MPEPDDPLSLILGLMQKNEQEREAIRTFVTESIQRDLTAAYEEIEQIRNTVTRLCSRPWAPNPRDIEAALYPHTRDRMMTDNA